MSTHLHETYAARADRALADPDAMLTAVRQRLVERARHRRQSIGAATGGAVLVAGVVGGTLLLTPAGDRGHHSTAGASGHPRSTAPSLTASTHPAPGHRITPARLTAADPAPGAPVALGETPQGWTYLGRTEASAAYGAPGATDRDPNSFLGKIVVLIGEQLDPSVVYPLTIAGHPGRVDISTTGDTDVVTVSVGKNLEVTIQVPHTAGLDQAGLVRMADTLEIRDLSHHASG